MQWPVDETYKLYKDRASVCRFHIVVWAVGLLGIGMSSISSAQEPKAMVSVSFPGLPSRANGTHTGVLEKVPQGHLLALLLRSWETNVSSQSGRVVQPGLLDTIDCPAVGVTYP